MSARIAPFDRDPDGHTEPGEVTRPAEFDLKTALTLTRDPNTPEDDDGAPDRAACIPVGVVLNGRYRIDRLLGHGGMGAVYRVDDQLYPGRKTALKLFLRRVTHSVDLFRAEFKTMASLRHPNVARVYDFEMVAGLDAFFFTMELLQGSTLSESLRHSEGAESALTLDRSIEGEEPLPASPDGRPAARTIPWRDALDLLAPVIRALSYLHSRSVIHFDLKPGNIMVGPKRPGRQVKVVDFGLAGLRGAGGRVMGTPRYLSPEIARRKKGDHRSDLYSLGVIAYQVLSGRVPYENTDSVPRLLVQKTTERVRFAPRERETVPHWLRDAIERLCAIDPDERHRTAGELLDELNRAGGLNYEPETQDTKESYLFSSQFVGRRREMAEVLKFIDQGLDKQAQGGLFVAGKSGMGKSRLMREVRQTVQLRGVAFLEADCFERDLSQSGPMANLVLQAAGLARSQEGNTLLRRYAPEMVKLVPSLALEGGAVPTPPLENADAERRRMIEAVAEFLFGLGRIVPYVAYVNDLQWAREGTTDLIATILRLRSGPGADTGLCLLGSYRIDDVGDRPLARLVESGASRRSLKVVELLPLEDLYVAELLKSMLGLSELPEGLASRVAESSGGLPFFVEEILRDLLEEGQLALLQGGNAGEALGLLRFDAAASFLKRTARVSHVERQVLDVLAVCGRPAEPGILRRVTGFAPSVVEEALQVLGEKQMVVAVAGEKERYNLAHDRMREALYASLSDDVRSSLHLGLARSLAESLDAEERGETLFETVGHFDQALRLLPKEPRDGVRERTSVARLHLRAALATNAVGAFESGVSYLERAKALLPGNAFEQEYGLALAVEHALASTLIPLGRIDEALAAAFRIVKHARSVLDEAPGWEARILGYTARNEYPKAITAGLEICGRLGMSLPSSPTLLDIAWNIGQVMWKLRGRTDEELVSLPRMTDERAVRLIRIMTSMNSGAYVTEPYLWPILISRTFILTLRHGRGPTHALRFAWFATALCAVGAYRTSVRFSRLSTRLMDAPEGAAFLPKLHHAMGQFLAHWREPMTRSAEWCRTGVILGERVEDAEFTGYCHMGWAKASLEAGTELKEVRKTCLDALETIRASGQRGTEVMHRPTLEAVETLMGLAPLSEDSGYDDRGLSLSNAQNGFRLLDKARLLCFFRKPASLSLGDDLLGATSVGLPATFYFSIAHYFAALGWLLSVRSPGAGPWSKAKGLLKVWRVRWTLSRWSQSCPRNFEHRSLLVEAEWLRTLGRSRRAIRKYEAAVAAAREHGFVQDAAFASELLAEVRLQTGNEEGARIHLLSALSGYSAWGADAKVKDLQTRYARLLTAT